jgi:hypothetical protein
MMVAMMSRAEFTPTEMREASMLAAMIHSETHLEPMFLPYDQQRLGSMATDTDR